MDFDSRHWQLSFRKSDSAFAADVTFPIDGRNGTNIIVTFYSFTVLTALLLFSVEIEIEEMNLYLQCVAMWNLDALTLAWGLSAWGLSEDEGRLGFSNFSASEWSVSDEGSFFGDFSRFSEGETSFLFLSLPLLEVSEVEAPSDWMGANADPCCGMLLHVTEDLGLDMETFPWPT